MFRRIITVRRLGVIYVLSYAAGLSNKSCLQTVNRHIMSKVESRNKCFCIAQSLDLTLRWINSKANNLTILNSFAIHRISFNIFPAETQRCMKLKKFKISSNELMLNYSSNGPFRLSILGKTTFSKFRKTKQCWQPTNFYQLTPVSKPVSK